MNERTPVEVFLLPLLFLILPLSRARGVDQDEGREGGREGGSEGGAADSPTQRSRGTERGAGSTRTRNQHPHLVPKSVHAAFVSFSEKGKAFRRCTTLRRLLTLLLSTHTLPLCSLSLSFHCVCFLTVYVPCVKTTHTHTKSVFSPPSPTSLFLFHFHSLSLSPLLKEEDSLTNCGQL